MAPVFLETSYLISRNTHQNKPWRMNLILMYNSAVTISNFVCLSKCLTFTSVSGYRYKYVFYFFNIVKTRCYQVAQIEKCKHAIWLHSKVAITDMEIPL